MGTTSQHQMSSVMWAWWGTLPAVDWMSVPLSKLILWILASQNDDIKMNKGRDFRNEWVLIYGTSSFPSSGNTTGLNPDIGVTPELWERNPCPSKLLEWMFTKEVGRTVNTTLKLGRTPSSKDAQRHRNSQTLHSVSRLPSYPRRREPMPSLWLTVAGLTRRPPSLSLEWAHTKCSHPRGPWHCHSHSHQSHQGNPCLHYTPGGVSGIVLWDEKL